MKPFFEDSRGKIFILNIDKKEYLLLETNKGFKRGGDYHQSSQHDIVLKGKINFYYRIDNEEKKLEMREGQCIAFLENIPHYLESLTDSLVLEWLENDFEKQYDKVYRKIVEE